MTRSGSTSAWWAAHSPNAHRVQGALLVAHGHPAVTEAFLATRLAGDRGGAYGTLPAGLDLAPILERAMVKGG